MPGYGGLCSVDEDSRSVVGAWLFRVVLTLPPLLLKTVHLKLGSLS